MASGLPARVVIVCALVATIRLGHAQVPPATPADRPPVTSPTAPSPPASPPGPQPTIDQANRRRPVAVIDLSTDKAAETLADQLYAILLNHPDLQPLAVSNLNSALKGPFVEEEAPSLDTARSAKQQAEEFLLQLDYPNAERSANNGMQSLHNVLLSPEILGLYAELAFASGWAQLRQRKPNDASMSFGLSFHLDPAKRPDPARYEPDIVEAYKLAETKTAVQAKLEVKGEGTVWIDGIDRGAAGTFDVAQGLHVIQLSGADRETRGQRINVPAQGTAVEIQAAPITEQRKVERARIELAQTKDSAARAGAVKKLAQLLGVKDAVLIEKGDGETLRVQTWRESEGFTKWVEHAEEPAADLLAPIAPPRKVEAPVKKDDGATKLPPMPEEKPFYRKRWFYGSVAAVVLAGAIYTYIKLTEPGMTTLDPNSTWEGE